MAQPIAITDVGHCFISGSLWGSGRVFQLDEWEAITIMLIGYQLTACCAETLVSYTDSTSVLSIGQVGQKGIQTACLSNTVALVLQEATF